MTGEQPEYSAFAPTAPTQNLVWAGVFHAFELRIICLSSRGSDVYAAPR
jgi:hypothetical protein